MAPIVISDADDATPAVGKLFDGLAFFLVQQLPTRASYIAKVQANGGRVVKLEKQADYIIADHFKLGCPPGSFSYTFIDAAIKAGALPDPEDHPAGPPLGALREVGSVGVPGKQTRTPFTAADDKELWEYVEKARSDGGMVKGNDIYKHLEKKNPRHTYQAWRDRYIKKLMDRPPAGCKVKEEEIGPVFTEQDYKNLVDNAEDIRQLDPNSEVAAWQAWADAFPEHTGPEWMKYWKETVYPAYRKTEEYKKLRRAEKLERERVERGAEGKEEGDEVLPERANGQDVVGGPPTSSRNTTAMSLERTENGAGRQEHEAPPKPSGSRQSARSQQDDGETSKKRAAVPEPSAAPSAKRRATQPVKDEPLSQTTRIHKSRPSASQGSSSQRRVSQYGRLKEDYSDLFVTEEEANKPIMPSKPQPPKRAINPDAPIEILSTDEERRRGKTAKPKRKPRKGRQEARAEASRHEHVGVEDDSALLMDGAGEHSAARNGDAMQLDRQPDLPNSELNRAAESQLRRESVHEAEEGDDGQQVFDDYVMDDEELPVQPVINEHARLPHMATATSTSPLMRAIEEFDKDLDSFLHSSEANREADRQVRRESGNGTGLAVEPLPVHGRYFDLPTSDANHAAEEHVRRESGNDTSAITEQREQYSELPTSDANNAAEEQMRRETGEHMHIRDDLEQAIEDFTVMNDAEEVDEEEFGDYLLEHNGTAVNVQGEVANVREGGEEPSLLTMLENVLATGIDDFERNVQALDEETRAEPSQRAQVRSEVLELGGSTPEDIEDGEDETMDVTISTHLVEDGEVEDGLPGKDILDHDEDAQTEDDLPEEEPLDREEGGEEEGLTDKAVLNAEDETVLPFVDIADESDGANDVTITNGFVQDDEDERDIDMSDDANASHGGGHALTAENLASQQAEHRPPVVRGVDLPEDDVAQDQGEFLSALQALMAQTKQAKKPNISHSTEQAVKHGLEEPAQQRPELEAQLVLTASPVPEAHAHKQQSGTVRHEASVSKAHNETDLVSNASHPRDTNGFMDLPITSEEDINDILESSLRWPYSPQQSKRQVAAVQQDESMQFETQIAYPKLRYEEESDVVFGEDEPEPKVLYPSLPVEVAKPAAEEEEEEEDMQLQFGVEPDVQPEEDDVHSQLGVDPEMQPEPEEEDLQSQLGFETKLATGSDGGFVVADHFEGFEEQDAAQNADEDEEEDDLEQEYEIDFDVPEPEGGFGFSSSPAKAAEVETVESRQSSPGVDTRHRNDLTHEQERSLYEESDGFESRQPEASFNVTSSPFRPSPRRPNLQSTRLASRAESLVDHEEVDDGIVVDVDAQGETIEISSAEPPSSPYQSSRAPSSQAGEELTDSKRQLATQDILDAETQLPDLSMPLPPDSEDEMSDADDETSAAASASRVPHHEAQPSLVEESEDDSQELPAPSAKQPQRAAAQSLPTPPLQPLRPFKKLTTEPPQAPLVPRIDLAETQSLEEDDIDEYITATKLRYNFSEEAIMHALKATSIRPDLAEIVLFDQRAGRKFPTDVPGIWTPEEDAIIEGGNARLIRQVQARHGSEECDKRLTWLEWYRAGG
ncbi:hypothetical protein LTR97_004577 [Elasticomyces elasticus]|uniref:Telomeric repeat-binding factor 2-interacting protein 1 n=1 Tax=Elasticomyces elasticus TaxID=574655 RepID=A0AAN8A3H1_9PEZI|nr:hypothetical protein LTR97_004577 [Elasticomyces elasticus]